MPTSVGPEIVVECDLEMKWACGMCTCLNVAEALSCTACGALAPHPHGSWECLTCSAWNPEHALLCDECNASLVKIKIKIKRIHALHKVAGFTV